MPSTDPNKPRGKNPRAGKKKKPEGPQTLIIPQISPEMLESARRAASEGKTQQEIEQAALDTARQQQEAAQAAQAAQAAEARPAAPQPAPRPEAEKRRRKTRAEAEAELAQRVHDDHLWLNNPVMMRGLGLAPIVVASSNCDNALMLCAAAILLLTTTRMLAVAVCHLTGNRFRPVIYVYSAAVLYIPAYCILYNLFGADLTLLGIYLPLMVVEPAIIKRMENPDLEPVGEAFRRGVNNTVGLCIAILLVGMLREFLGAGSMFGAVLLDTPPLPIASEPAGGFILVGLVAALWTGVANAYVRYKQEEVRHNYAERRR